jgi:hypothetical protein
VNGTSVAARDVDENGVDVGITHNLWLRPNLRNIFERSDSWTSKLIDTSSTL